MSFTDPEPKNQAEPTAAEERSWLRSTAFWAVLGGISSLLTGLTTLAAVFGAVTVNCCETDCPAAREVAGQLTMPLTGVTPEEAETKVVPSGTGITSAVSSVVAPAYIAEVSPAAIRGRLTTLQQLAIVVGLQCAFLSNYLIAHAAGGAGALRVGGESL